MADLETKVEEQFGDVWEAIRILGMNIDYRKYVRFRSLTPPVFPSPEEGYLISKRREEPVVAKEDVQFCIDFTVESAITIQEFESSLDR